LAAFGLRVPFYASGGMAFLGFLASFFFVKEPEIILKDYMPIDAVIPSAKDIETDTALSKRDEGIELTSKEEKVPLTKNEPEGVSPYFNLASYWNGLGQFLLMAGYMGYITIVPLLLLDPFFGLTSSTVTEQEAKKVALTSGYLFGMMGAVQTLMIIFAFPRLLKQFGAAATAGVGALVTGAATCLITLVDRVPTFIPLIIGYGIGVSLLRPYFTAKASSLAPKGRSTQYLAFNQTFSNIAAMVSAQLSLVYPLGENGRIAAFLIVGGAYVLCSLMLLFDYLTEKKKNTSPATPEKEKSELEKFFGQGEEEEKFWSDLQKKLKAVLLERNFDRALKAAKGQFAIQELILRAIPELPTPFEDRMQTVHNIYINIGKEDWAEEMETMMPFLEHLRHDAGVHVSKHSAL